MIERDGHGDGCGFGHPRGDGFGDVSDRFAECFADCYGDASCLRNGNGICDSEFDDSIVAVLEDE